MRLGVLIIISFMVLQGCQPAAESQDMKTAGSVTGAEPDAESLYQARGKWDNQYGDTLELRSLTGKIPILSMVFTRCTSACPRIVADMQAIEAKLPEDRKDEVVFVLISFDSERDHTENLKEFTKTMKLSPGWLVLHGSEEDVRELSMLLDVKYRKLLNGDFTHSSSISMLDQKGSLVVQSEGLGKDPGVFIEAITNLPHSGAQ